MWGIPQFYENTGAVSDITKYGAKRKSGGFDDKILLNILTLIESGAISTKIGRKEYKFVKNND